MANRQDDEHDMYVSQLKEVFESCDNSGTGQLDRQELEKLCTKLQLEDQTDALVIQLIGTDPSKKVKFDEFKEGFVAVLSDVVEGISSEDELEYDTDLGTTGGTGSPRLFRARRRYGRRTLPDSSEGEGTLSQRYNRRTLPDSSEGEGTMGTADFSEYSAFSASRTRSSHGQTTSSRVSSFDVEEEVHQPMNESNYDDVDGPSNSQASQNVPPKIPETFEAEGEGHQNIGDMEPALDPVSEEEHLKEIWRELRVGKSGYLTLPELATVCEHIGMDEMNQEELEHLFAKLDTDGDGLVSFQEFLQGLFQHGGPMTPSPSMHSRSPSRPLSTPRMKHKLATSFDAGDRQTPSYVTHGSGLFSEIDPENTGYSSGEAVIELWQGLGIPQGADVLEFLQFDPHSKINLAELSYALEQELHTVEDDNAAYHVAVATYENEVRFLRNNTEHLAAERDKLRSDYTDANQRITILVKEGDDRCTALEKLKDKEIASLDSKCQETIRNLHSDMDKERESLIQAANKQQAKLETDIELLKEEEIKLREKLNFFQKELDKMEEEMFDVMENSSEIQNQNVRLTKELQETDSVRSKLEELESQRANILDEQQKFSGHKLLQLEQENKVLKDKTDELTMEVEDLSQQLSGTRKNRRGIRQKNLDSPLGLPKGSNMGDYVQQGSETSEDDKSPKSRRKRQLPEQPSINSDDGSVFGGMDIQEIKQQHRLEMQELEKGVIIERKDIEDAFKLEIAELEDNHIREKNEMVKQFNKEKDILSNEFSEKLQASLIEREQNLHEVFDHEAQNMSIVHESEKTLLEQNYAQEKADVIQRMREEFDSELTHKLEAQKQDYMHELEQTVTRDGPKINDDYKREITELQLQLKLQEEELQLGFKQRLATLQQEFEEQQCTLNEKHRLKILDYENKLAKGVDGLQGKLKTDFDQLLETHKLQVTQEEKRRMSLALDQEKDAIVEEFTRQQEQIVRKLKRERREVEQKQKCEITDLKGTLDTERDTWQRERQQVQLQMEMERDALQSQHLRQQAEGPQQQEALSEIQQLQSALEQERRNLEIERQSLHAQFEAGVTQERDQLERERDSLKQLMEEEISRELHAQMEDEFLDQMERVKAAYKDEQSQLEVRVKMLQEELDDINNTRDMEERFRERMEVQSKDSELKFRSQLDELRKSNEKLRNENVNLEKELCERAVMQQKPLSVTSDATITSTLAPRTSLPATNTLRDKQDHERLIGEKKVLQQEIEELHIQLKSTQETHNYTEQYKTQLEIWEMERSSLETQLELTTDKLARLNTNMSLKDSEHLRDIHHLKEKLSQTIAVTKYNNLNAKLLESEKQAKQLATGLEDRTAQTNKFIQGLRCDHDVTMKQLQKEKENIDKKLQLTRQLLDSQVKKLKQKLEYTSRLDMLVKELYVENASLMKCLEMSERRGVSAENQVHGLEEKCRVMNRVLKKVGTSALV